MPQIGYLLSLVFIAASACLFGSQSKALTVNRFLMASSALVMSIAIAEHCVFPMSNVGPPAQRPSSRPITAQGLLLFAVAVQCAGLATGYFMTTRPA